MSSKNSQNDSSATESKPSENEDQPNTDKYTGIENSIKTHAVFSDNKSIMQTKESIINVDSNTDTGAKNQGIKINDANVPADKSNIHRKNEYMEKRQYRTQIKPPKSLWVFFNYGGTALPFDGKELFYDTSDNDLVRLMFTIYLAMLLFTFAFVALVWFIPINKLAILKNLFQTIGVFFAIPAIIMLVALVYSMACLPCTRLYPFNIISVVLAVICSSVIHAAIAAFTDIGHQILLATMIIVIVCIIITCTKFDFSGLFLYVIVIVVAYLAVSLVLVLGPMLKGQPRRPQQGLPRRPQQGLPRRPQQGPRQGPRQRPRQRPPPPRPADETAPIKLLVGTILNAVIVVAELQIILEGKFIEMRVDDYILGAFLLYTSVIDLFLKLPQKLCSKDS